MKYAAVAALVFIGDFCLKRQVEKQQEIPQGKKLFKGRIAVKRFHNRGAAMNFLEKCPGLVKKISGAVLFVVGLLWFLFLRKKQNPALLFGLSLMVGGGANNLYDRMAKGYVLDYFSFCTPWKRLDKLVFNLSDLCIILGGILVILFGRPKRQ